jgi:hypothetical protein
LIPTVFRRKVLASINWRRTFPMTAAREIRDLIEQTTTGTRRRRVPEEVKEQVRRYAERRHTQAATWKAIGRETGLEARELRA